MEKNSKDDKKNKKKYKELLVVHSGRELTNALTSKTSFQLGPSFTSINIPFSYSVSDKAGLITKALKDNTTLKSITFGESWNEPDADVDVLEKSLLANTSIDTIIFNYFSFLSSHKKFMKTLIKILTKNHRIQHVAFEYIDDDTDPTVLDPFCQNIHLFGLKSLKIVELCNLHNIAIFNALPNSPTITSFHVKYAHQSPEVFNSMVDGLMANPRITDLEIGSTKSVIAGDRWLKFKPVLERDHLRRLVFKYINYSNNAPIQEYFDNALSILQNSKSLEELGFVYGNLNWTFLGNILSKSKSIKKLSIDGANLEDFTVLKLDQNETLTEVSFINCHMASKYLPEIINHNEFIKKLQYEIRHLNQEDCNSFLRAFKNNSTLTDLQFVAESSELPLCDLFSEVLAVNRSIRRLKFNFQNCEYESACRFIDALKINTTLTELSLEKANLLYAGSQNKPPGAPTFDLLLADLLHINESLTYFGGSEEFPEIDTALKRNLENQRTLITNGKMFVQMLLMRPKTYGSIIPPEIWCVILRHMTVPGSDWNAEQFYCQNL